MCSDLIGYLRTYTYVCMYVDLFMYVRMYIQYVYTVHYVLYTYVDVFM